MSIDNDNSVLHEYIPAETTQPTPIQGDAGYTPAAQGVSQCWPTRSLLKLVAASLMPSHV